MSPTLKPTSWAPPIVLVYVTLGALLTAWSIIGGLYAYWHPFEDKALYYVGAGILGTGLVLLAIGFSAGWITRTAREAELPPDEPDHRQAG